MDLSQPFPAYNTQQHEAAVRTYCRDQIARHVGEADDALVTFVLQHISNPTTPMAAYMADLQEVLEDDAPQFMRELLAFVQQLESK